MNALGCPDISFMSEILFLKMPFRRPVKMDNIEKYRPMPSEKARSTMENLVTNAVKTIIFAYDYAQRSIN